MGKISMHFGILMLGTSVACSFRWKGLGERLVEVYDHLTSSPSPLVSSRDDRDYGFNFIQILQAELNLEILGPDVSILAGPFSKAE